MTDLRPPSTWDMDVRTKQLHEQLGAVVDTMRAIDGSDEMDDNELWRLAFCGMFARILIHIEQSDPMLGLAHAMEEVRTRRGGRA